MPGSGADVLPLPSVPEDVPSSTGASMPEPDSPLPSPPLLVSSPLLPEFCVSLAPSVLLSEPVLLLPLELLPLPELLLPSELLFPEVLPERSPEPLLLLPEVPLLPEVLFSSPPVVSLLSVSSGSFSSSLGLLVFLEELLPLPFDGPETTSIFVIGFS